MVMSTYLLIVILPTLERSSLTSIENESTALTLPMESVESPFNVRVSIQPNSEVCYT